MWGVAGWAKEDSLMRLELQGKRKERTHTYTHTHFRLWARVKCKTVPHSTYFTASDQMKMLLILTRWMTSGCCLQWCVPRCLRVTTSLHSEHLVSSSVSCQAAIIHREYKVSVKVNHFDWQRPATCNLLSLCFQVVLWDWVWQNGFHCERDHCF